jgi:hypothetical protein
MENFFSSLQKGVAISDACSIFFRDYDISVGRITFFFKLSTLT